MRRQFARDLLWIWWDPNWDTLQLASFEWELWITRQIVRQYRRCRHSQEGWSSFLVQNVPCSKASFVCNFLLYQNLILVGYDLLSTLLFFFFFTFFCSLHALLRDLALYLFRRLHWLRRLTLFKKWAGLSMHSEELLWLWRRNCVLWERGWVGQNFWLHLWLLKVVF